MESEFHLSDIQSQECILCKIFNANSGVQTDVSARSKSVGSISNRLAQAQTILLRCGAVSYGVNHLMNLHEKCLVLLEELEVPNPQLLQQPFDKIIAPVNQLLDRVNNNL